MAFSGYFTLPQYSFVRKVRRALPAVAVFIVFAALSACTVSGNEDAVNGLPDAPESNIRLNASNLELTAGDDFLLEWENAPGGHAGITWESDNGAVASVTDNGAVTGVAGGSATVTTIALDIAGSSLAVLTCKIVVEPKVKLKIDDFQLAVGGRYQIEWDVLPAGTSGVTWESEDTAVVSVTDNGVVTGVSVGNATITTTAVDGAGNPLSVLTCTVTVASETVIPGELLAILVRGGDREDSGETVYLRAPDYTRARALIDAVTMATGGTAAAPDHIKLMDGSHEYNGFYYSITDSTDKLFTGYKFLQISALSGTATIIQNKVQDRNPEMIKQDGAFGTLILGGGEGSATLKLDGNRKNGHIIGMSGSTTVILKDGVIITNCGTESNGGRGVNVGGGRLVMEGGVISRNTYLGSNTNTNGGAGVYISNGSFSKTGGTIYGNDAGENSNISRASIGKDRYDVRVYGHAVFHMKSSNVYRYREATADATCNINTGNSEGLLAYVPAGFGENSVALTSNQWTESNLPYANGGSIKWFDFSVTQTGTYYMHGLWYGSLGGLEVVVYDENGAFVADGSTSTRMERNNVKFNISKAGKYYFEIRPYMPGQGGDFKITYSRSSKAPN